MACQVGPDGTVPCDPEALRAAAARRLGRSLSLEAYSLARNIASEISTGTAAEKISVAEAAVNRAGRAGVSISRLVMRNGTRYAQQSGTNPPVSSAQEPSAADVFVAEWVLARRSGGLARGATHYFAPKYYSSAETKEIYDRWTDGWGSPSAALSWVGPIEGVRPRELFLMRPGAPDATEYAEGLRAAQTGEEPARKSWIAAALGLSALAGAAWYLWRSR